MVVGLPVALPLLVPAISWSDVRFHADDRLDSRFSGLFLELPRAVQVTVIRDGEGGLLELQRPRDQVVNAICAVEKGVFRVAVEMNEGHSIRISELTMVR